MSRKIYTKAIVLNAAIKIAKEVGLEKIGIRAIARELNTSVSPVYDAYESIELLIKDIIIAIFDENAAQTSYFKRNEDVLHYGLKHPRLYRDIQKYTRENDIKTTHYEDLILFMKKEDILSDFPDLYLQSLNFDILIYISGLVNLSMSNHVFNYDLNFYLEALKGATGLFVKGYRKHLDEERKIWVGL